MGWNCYQKWSAKELHESLLRLKWLHRKLIMSPSHWAKPLMIPTTYFDWELCCRSTWKSFKKVHVIYRTQTLRPLYRLRPLYYIYTYIYSLFLFWQNWMNLRLQWAEKSQWASHDQVQFTFLPCRVQLLASSRKNKHLMASWLLCDFYFSAVLKSAFPLILYVNVLLFLFFFNIVLELMFMLMTASSNMLSSGFRLPDVLPLHFCVL